MSPEVFGRGGGGKEKTKNRWKRETSLKKWGYYSLRLIGKEERKRVVLWRWNNNLMKRSEGGISSAEYSRREKVH